MTYGPVLCHGWLPRYVGPHPSLYGVQVGRHFPTRWVEYAFVVESLDLLCGKGTVADLATGFNPEVHNLSIIMARMGFAVIALDSNPETLRLPAHDRVDRRVASLTETGLDDASVDVVTCISTMEHLNAQERLAFWQEAHRILKPDGMVLVTADWLSPIELAYPIPGAPRRFETGSRVPDPVDRLDPNIAFLRGMKR